MVLVIKLAMMLALWGNAAHYHPGMMGRVSRNRGLPLVGCMVASAYYPLGAWVRVTSLKGRGSRVCRVTDVTRRSDLAYIRRKQIVVELDYPSALALCPNLTSYGSQPPRACPVKVQRIY